MREGKEWTWLLERYSCWKFIRKEKRGNITKHILKKNVNKYKSIENNIPNTNVSIMQPKNDRIMADCISSVSPLSQIILEYPRYNITSLCNKYFCMNILKRRNL